MANKGTERTCFIIMPITTPEPFLDRYRDGAEHFRHVLECLFVPSVEQAGYAAIRPVAKGSDVIHEGIVNNLETADLVLCDMSCLNANVFFEFGIRTALNKPVCVVRDDLTLNVPFDTGILNHMEYSSSIEPWELEAEAARLSKHLKDSQERSDGKNSLWKIFGLKTEARSYEGETGTDAKLDLLAVEIAALAERIDAFRGTGRPELSVLRRASQKDAIDEDELKAEILARLPAGVKPLEVDMPDNRTLRLIYDGHLPPDLEREMDRYFRKKWNVGVFFTSNDVPWY